MPTAAKLAAFVLFGALAWVVSRLTIPYVFEEGESAGRFAEINAVIGGLLGWRLAGARAGYGWMGSIGYGITTAVASVITVLFLQSFLVMISQSLKKLYDGPMDAIVGVFDLMGRYGANLMHQEVLVTLAVGAVLAGLLTEWFGRNFR